MLNILLTTGPDDLDLTIGARKLFENLAAKDKSLRTFPDADH
jgi:hypothetical protein